MTSNHQPFLDKYFAETNRFQQLTMLKNYMLSLPLEALTEFTMEPLQSLGKELEGNKLTQAQRESIFDTLGELEAMLRMKAVA